MENQKELRMMLSQSLQFRDWATILRARGRPGCFGIGLDLLLGDPCLEFKSSSLSSWKNKLRELTFPRLELHYSTLGGEDHKRSMEWLQSEWKKNLNLNVTVKGLDNALFQREMSENPPSIFRFGVSLEFLSCTNALENFLNIPRANLPFKREPLLGVVEQLKKRSNGVSEENLCQKALDTLLSEHWIIPLGRIHISLLVKPEWRGWTLSALNYLDLSQLHLE
jgi:oligopeptide transport system substrate-binding protein